MILPVDSGDVASPHTPSPWRVCTTRDEPSTGPLAEALRAHGFIVRRTQHYQFLLFPLLAAARVLGRNSRRSRDHEDLPPPWLNATLNAINALEVTAGRLVFYPIGSTVIALASAPV